MIILTVRTDNPQAEIGLFDDKKELAYEKWPAHRELSESIHQKVQKLLDSQGLSLKSVSGIVCFKGPGSFTGLRIGLSVGNALAAGLGVPIIGATGNDWVQTGAQKLSNGEDEVTVMPQYGADPHITKPKK